MSRAWRLERAPLQRQRRRLLERLLHQRLLLRLVRHLRPCSHLREARDEEREMRRGGEGGEGGEARARREIAKGGKERENGQNLNPDGASCASSPIRQATCADEIRLDARSTAARRRCRLERSCGGSEMRWSDEGDDGAVALAVGARNNGGEAAVDACAGAAARPSEAIKWRALAASQLHGATSNRGGRRDGCRRAGGVGDRCQVPRWRFGGAAL